MKKSNILFPAMLLGLTTLLYPQQTSAAGQDSTGANGQSPIYFRGWGNALYQDNTNAKTATADLQRLVLDIGRNFNSNISFFSELEMDDAVLAGGSNGGQLAVEQVYIKFNTDPTHYFKAGLILPTIGIMNENHLPPLFNGNERTQVETNVIPTTWRDIGVGYYGGIAELPLNYSVALLNGLSSAMFTHGSGIKNGRFQGRNATANNMAVNAALKYAEGTLKAQVTGYYGGTVGISSQQADTMGLNSGLFGTPVAIGEADIRYAYGSWSFRALGTYISIPDAEEINRAYKNNTPESEYGAYAEIGYDLLGNAGSMTEPHLIAFSRYEKLDLNSSIPANGVTDGTLDQSHILVGLNYLPISTVVIKADVRFEHTGAANIALTAKPSPTAPPYDQNNSFINLGIGFTF
jgi:hypothetical protein